ncbi:MAG TPA: hypothetical protein VHG30_01970 [Microvirga sp.]|nr:hypothetical protein [Microvirga sp.]
MTTQMAKVPSTAPAAEAPRPKEIAKRRREHLRRIHRMTHEQQLALIEEARAARQAAPASTSDRP